MSVFNNSARTIDGQNTLICDIIEISEELILNGDNGSNGAIVKSDGVNARWALLTDLLVAGTGINITGSTISTNNIPNASLTNSTISGKALGSDLDTLTAGTNITLSGGYNGSAPKTISSTDTTYTAGTGLSLSVGNEFSTSAIPNASLSNSTISGKSLGSDLDTLTAGTNITLSGGYNGSAPKTISSANTEYTAGTGLSLSGTEFRTDSIPNVSLSNSTISGKSLGTNLGNLTAGANITLSGGYNGSADKTISSTDTNTTYTAGTGLSLSVGNEFSTSSIPNSSLTNNTISGKVLGSNLDPLAAGDGLEFTSGTSYNGSATKTMRVCLNNPLEIDSGCIGLCLGRGLEIDGDGCLTIKLSGSGALQSDSSGNLSFVR